LGYKIIHTQESQALNEDVPMDEVIPQDMQEPNADVAPMDEGVQANPPPQRRSERLKKDITLTTKEKGEMMAKKRNLEGTCPNQNMFSVLPIDEITELTSSMGIDIDSSDFGTFDLLKDLECARHDLFVK
jgi:hypothetical protein